MAFAVDVVCRLCIREQVEVSLNLRPGLSKLLYEPVLPSISVQPLNYMSKSLAEVKTIFCGMCKIHDIQIPVSINVPGTQPHSFVYMLLFAAFALQQQNGILVTGHMALRKLTNL